jgi:hypothetical protein
VHPAPCKTKRILDGVEVLIMMTMKSIVFWVEMPCKSEMASHFGGTYSLHFQGQRMKETQKNKETSSVKPTHMFRAQLRYHFLCSHFLWVPLQTVVTLCWALSQFSSGLNWATSGWIFHPYFPQIVTNFCWFLA